MKKRQKGDALSEAFRAAFESTVLRELGRVRAASEANAQGYFAPLRPMPVIGEEKP